MMAVTQLRPIRNTGRAAPSESASFTRSSVTSPDLVVRWTSKMSRLKWTTNNQAATQNSVGTTVRRKKVHASAWYDRTAMSAISEPVRRSISLWSPNAPR